MSGGGTGGDDHRAGHSAGDTDHRDRCSTVSDHLRTIALGTEFAPVASDPPGAHPRATAGHGDADSHLEPLVLGGVTARVSRQPISVGLTGLKKRRVSYKTGYVLGER